MGRDKPHVTTADAWEAVHRATGTPIVADAYSRVFRAERLKIERQPVFDALCRLGDELGVRWRMDGGFLLCRSTSYFWDKLKEVPARQLRRWAENRRQNGSLPLEDVLEIATLSDRQLDSRLVGYGVAHCWELLEWGIVGSVPFRPRLDGGGYARRYARLLAGLGPDQRRAALSPAGLPFGQLSPPQQEELAGVLVRHGRDPRLLADLLLRVEYVPAGVYVWFPQVTTSAEAERGRREWPMVSAKTAEAVLAEARRFDPAAEAGEIHRSPGVLSITFTNPSLGATWNVGGPGVGLLIQP
jgi:hypothetical protein